MPTSPFSPFGRQTVTALAAGTCVKPVFSGSMGGASKASQSGLCKGTIGLCQSPIGLCDRCAIGLTRMQNVNLRFCKKQNEPDPENRADALSAGLTALQVHCPLLAAGLLNGRLDRLRKRKSQSR